MSMKIAIYGFGRIGKLIFQLLRERKLLDIIKLTIIADRFNSLDYLAYKINNDSVHRFNVNKLSNEHIDDNNKSIHIDDHRIQYIQVNNNNYFPNWNNLEVDCVIDSTGAFIKTSQLREHIKCGAKKVIITAPYKDDDQLLDKIMLIMGVNDDQYNHNKHSIISCSSCTSNAIMPIIYALKKNNITINSGSLMTIHAATSSQKIVDGSNEKNWRLSRSILNNIIPTKTGFVNSLSYIYPDLYNKISGFAIRVPINDVSLVDFTFMTDNLVCINSIDSMIRCAASSYLNNILGYINEYLVSSDLIGNPLSSIYDSKMTASSNVTNSKGNNFFKILTWYDNEYGYANRVLDTLLMISKNMNNDPK